MNKKEKKQYDALLSRIVDIFNGACGEGFDADEWKDNWAVPEQMVHIMRAVKCLWGEKLKELVFSKFEIEYFHMTYFENPNDTAKWLWELGVRE